MKCKLFSVTDGSYPGHQQAIEQNYGWWVRFGSEVFVYVADKKATECFKSLSSRGGLEFLKDLPDTKKGDTFLIEQKGRIFQLEHPAIEIIHDQGRYLVATVPKDALKNLQEEHRTCFRLTPLQENTVVYDLVPAGPKSKARRAEFANSFTPLDASRFQADLVKLTSWKTRLSNSPAYLEAAQWADSQLKALGYDTAIETVSIGPDKTSYNVVASKAGSLGDAGSVLVAGAHLDSINHIDGDSGPAPGADDNASGAAGVIALARWAANSEYKNTLTFILFGGEEQGLFGSLQFVTALTSVEQERISGMINMDMIGSLNEERASVLLEGAVVSQGMIDTLAMFAQRYTDLLVETSLNPFASDHVPFIEAGIPAVLTIEGADSSNGRVHTAEDKLEFVSLDYALDILKTVAASVDYWLEPTSEAVHTEIPCTHCTDTDAGGTENYHQLLLHYQQLLATYGRLYDTGQLATDMYASYQATWYAYQQLMQLDESNPA